MQVISVGGTKADQYHTWSLPTIWHWYNMRFKRWHFFSSTVPLALKLAKLASFKQPVWSNSAITSPDTNSPDEQALMAAKKRRRRAISQCSSQCSWPPSLSPPSLPLCMSSGAMPTDMPNFTRSCWEENSVNNRMSTIWKSSENSPNTSHPWSNIRGWPTGALSL